MTQETGTSWYTGLSRKYALLVAVAVSLCVFAVAWMVCSLEYQNRKKDVLAAQEETLAAWVSGTVDAVEVWTDSLHGQARRVSGSDLYRLFASELAQMDERTAALINEADSGVTLPDSAAALAEEVPLIRNLLLDFMTYSGLLDARIVSPAGQTVLSALSRPTPVTGGQRDTVARAVRDKAMTFAPVRASASGLVLDVADPMSAVMDDGDGQGAPVAALLITTPVTGPIAQFLARDLRQADLKPHLLQRVGETWEDLRVQAAVPAPLDAARAASLNPGPDGNIPFALRPSLSGEGEVYSLGARVPGMDWWVVLEVPAGAVASALRYQAGLIYGIGALVGLGFVLGLALLWWILVGRQQRVIAERFKGLYQLIERQKRLLDSVNVSLDVGLFMADVTGQLQVGNRAFAEIVERDEDELAGNNLGALFDGLAAGRLIDGIRQVADADEASTFELTLPRPDGERLYRVTLFPFEDGTDDGAKGAVGIVQDITEFRRNSEKRRLQQKHTMDAFVRAIEGVDPYLAGHSHKMAALGGLVARSMGLDEADRNTIVMAAELSQVGKLFVPRELLTKTGRLSAEEQAEMARVPDHAYRVLRDIDFELPVPAAIHEMYERMDGTGYPQHLQGEAISVHARVLAVVNAFCAMVSPRSYRAGMNPEEALRTLHADPAFDPAVVERLAEVLATPEGEKAVEA